MADIIVTTPKTQTDNAAREAADAKEHGGDTRYFRRFPLSVYLSLCPGDRVYYVEDGYLRGFAVVCESGEEEEPRFCDTTGQEYAPGYYVRMRADSWQWIEPIPMTGFQGYRFAHKAGMSREAVKIVGGWLDPKPMVG